MDDLMEVSTYKEFKSAFDREVRNQAESFIRMGYLLRIAEDTDILYESGYKSIAEFAREEYKLPADYVSRMMDVNRRYSDGGYSDRIAPKYQGYGYTLLSEMLKLSDAVVEALPDKVTREEIRELKKEIREENATTDIEVLLEGEEQMQQELDNNLIKVLHQNWRENVRDYQKMFKAVTTSENQKETALQLLAPSGIGMKIIRIKGIGKFLLSIKGADQDLELVNVRTDETEKYTWDDCAKALSQLCRGKNYKDAYEKAYGEPYPEEEMKKDAKTTRVQNENPVKEPGKNHGITEKASGIIREPDPVPEEEESGEDDQECQVNTEEKEEIAPAQITGKTEGVSAMQEQVIGDPVLMGQQDGATQEAVQQSIDAYKEVLPAGYQPIPEVITRKEVELWKGAAQSAVRLFNTLERNDWNPDCIKLVHEMCIETANLKAILETLEEMMEHGE